MFASPLAQARVFVGRTDALAWAFPDVQRVEERSHLLSDAQLAKIRSLGGGDRDSRLIRFYKAYGPGEDVVGYALIDIHNVRTLPEAFLIVLSPEGSVERLRVLAFHEPIEYLPPERWLEQFSGRNGEGPMRVGRDVHGIAGSTLTAYAVAGGIRRAFALYRVVMSKE